MFPSNPTHIAIVLNCATGLALHLPRPDVQDPCPPHPEQVPKEVREHAFVAADAARSLKCAKTGDASSPSKRGPQKTLLTWLTDEYKDPGDRVLIPESRRLAAGSPLREDAAAGSPVERCGASTD